MECLIVGLSLGGKHQDSLNLSDVRVVGRFGAFVHSYFEIFKGKFPREDINKSGRDLDSKLRIKSSAFNYGI